MEPEFVEKVGEIADQVEAFKANHQTALDEVAGRIDEIELSFKCSNRFAPHDGGKVSHETKAMANWLSGRELGPDEPKALSISADGQDVTVRDDWNNNMLRRMYHTFPMGLL